MAPYEIPKMIRIIDQCPSPQSARWTKRRSVVITQIKGSDGEPADQIAHPIKMSRCKPTYRFAGVKLGEHNNELLEELEIPASLKEALTESRAMG